MPTSAPLRAALYARQSKGDLEGIDRQIPRTTAVANARGWVIVDQYTDNDVSASKSRGAGTGWARMLADASAGRIDTVIAVDLDRLLRTTRDLNVLIDHGLKAVTVDGEIDLSTADGEFRATMLAGIARFEVRRKGERQSRAQRQRAELGKPPKGVRLTGYELDGSVIPAEAAIVKEIFQRFAAGDSLAGITKDLQNRGVQTRRGGRWIPSTARGILTNARYAGASVYRGDVVGEAKWEAIVPRDQFDAVQSRLNDPGRRTNLTGDTSRKHLGSGVYFCGAEGCGGRIKTSGGGQGGHRYTCREAHFYRMGEPIDAMVLAAIDVRLGMPNLHDLLVKPADKSRLKELNDQRSALTARLVRYERDYEAENIDGRQFRDFTEKVKVQLAEIDRESMTLVATQGLGGILSAADPVAAFADSSLDIQRRIIDALLEVTLLPAPQGRKGFDPSSVRLTWR